jgi:ankyrin repeat protein/mono/diheme cytochrome c family protein
MLRDSMDRVDRHEPAFGNLVHLAVDGRPVAIESTGSQPNTRSRRTGSRLRKLYFAVLVAACGVNGASADEPAKVDFVRDVQPLFKAHCTSCHGSKQQKNGFRLDRRRDALRGGVANQIAPGNSEASHLYFRLVGDRDGLQMPPDGPLSPEQIKILKAWIDQGAVWPDEASGETLAPPPDPKATRLMDVLRNGDRAAFRKLLREEPGAAKLKGPGGSTLLMYAVLYGDADSVRLLLEAGADLNIRNEAGATPLMWAVDDADKTRLLIRGGADVNARSDDGRTPLFIAAARPGSYDVVKLLLDHKANPSLVVNRYGPTTPLRLAAEAGDETLLRLLLDRGADAKAMGGVFPLLAAMNANDPGCVSQTLKSADRGALKGAGIFLVPPFGSPAALRDPKAVKAFLEAGADAAARDPAGRTLLMLAVGSDDVPVETVQTLIRLAGDVNATTAKGRTALDFARQAGRTAVAVLLVKSGAKPGREAVLANIKPKPAASVRAAVERSLPLLQRADVKFLRKSGCVSCHHNSLAAMTVASARKAGIPVDEKIALTQRKEIGAYLEVWRERALQGMGIPGDSNTVNYLLTGLAAEGYPPDEATDAMARYLKNDQMPDGRWRLIANRPPLESSEFEVAAVAMRGLQVYAPKALRADYEKAVWRAADWMRTAKPRSTADRTFQLLGLTWAGDSKDLLEKLAADLLAEQRADGGWAQLPTMTSDAYATGQALAALHQSGAVAAADPAYQRGVKYLLSTQLEDGSWHVRSRAIPFQPYFESGFPHGPDQWISAAATNWAVMALIPATK